MTRNVLLAKVSKATTSIFIYGTLRPPRPESQPDDSRFYSEIAPYVVSATPARVEGAVLYDLGAYPCARPGTGTVYGEALQVKPEALAIADRIEGHPHLFERQPVAVQTDAGTEQAWLYWASPELIEDCPRIVSGDWFARKERKDTNVTHG